MRKILYPVMLAVAGIFFYGYYQNTSAQVCSPDPQYTNGGLWPDSVTDLDTAYLGVAYSQLMTIVVPPDTPLFPPPVPPISIDSLILTSLNNLPPGLSYACNNSRCSFKGNTKDCAIITGTPTSAGIYDISGTVDAYLGGSGSPQSYPLSNYRIVVKAAIGIKEQESLKLLKIYPVPFSDNISILFFSQKPGWSTISIYNAIGKEVNKFNNDVVKGTNNLTLNLSLLPDGIYYLTVTGKEILYSRKILKYSNE